MPPSPELPTTPPSGQPLAVRPPASNHRSGRWVVAAIAAPLAVVAGWFALGMPGMDHGPAEHEMTSMSAPATGGLRELAPAEFAALDPGVTVINVHVPDEGAIDRTDATIDYREIIGATGLPAKDAPIALYCMSGRMSTIAGEALIADGYTNVAHLAGGMRAWAADGRALIDP